MSIASCGNVDVDENFEIKRKRKRNKQNLFLIKERLKIWFRFSVITSLASTFCLCVSPEENLSPRWRKRTMTTEENSVVREVLNAL